MQLSTRGRYAVMAMVELACRNTSAPVTLAELAAGQQLSQCYLEQLFGALRRAGLVVAARGPGGGYRLARPASSLCIFDILAAVDENLETTRCHGGEPGCLRSPDGRPLICRTHDLWSALGRQIQVFLKGVTLDDVVAGRMRDHRQVETVA